MKFPWRFVWLGAGLVQIVACGWFISAASAWSKVGVAHLVHNYFFTGIFSLFLGVACLTLFVLYPYFKEERRSG